MTTGWRIVKTRHANTAFDGEGARLYGGRWNSPGTRMIYTASRVSLAVLEILVHLDKANLLSSYSLIAARLDDTRIQRLERQELPEGWRAYPAPSTLQRIGDEWVESRRSVVLEVPSVIVEDESIYLINPAHPEFSSMSVGEPKPFYFDQRLVSRRE